MKIICPVCELFVVEIKGSNGAFAFQCERCLSASTQIDDSDCILDWLPTVHLQ